MNLKPDDFLFLNSGGQMDFLFLFCGSPVPLPGQSVLANPYVMWAHRSRSPENPEKKR